MKGCLIAFMGEIHHHRLASYFFWTTFFSGLSFPSCYLSLGARIFHFQIKNASLKIKSTRFYGSTNKLVVISMMLGTIFVQPILFVFHLGNIFSFANAKK